MFLENLRNIFCLKNRDLVSSTCVAWGRKRGNSWETLTLNVSRECFFVCVPMQHMLKTESRRKNYFSFFLFAHPNNAVSNIDMNVSAVYVFWFATAFTP